MPTEFLFERTDDVWQTFPNMCICYDILQFSPVQCSSGKQYMHGSGVFCRVSSVFQSYWGDAHHCTAKEMKRVLDAKGVAPAGILLDLGVQMTAAEERPTMCL